MKRGENQLQAAILETIVKRFPKKSEAVEGLMEILNVNRDGIYRRLRGDTLLNAPEIHLLATTFNISLDEVMSNQQNKITFSYNRYDQRINSFHQYLSQILHLVDSFGKMPGFRVFYASREIPLFIYKMFPKTLTFKLYVYGITTWHMDYLKDEPFSFDLLKPQDLEVANLINRTYSTIDSTDFWTMNILEQTLSQIEFMAHAGRFVSAEVALEVCADIFDIVQHCRAMAEAGKKFMPGSTPTEGNGKFDLFANELAATNNTILGISDHLRALFITFDTPNYLYTSNQRICRSIEDWFNKLLNHSIHMSVHSGRSRNMFFNRLEQRVHQTEKKLEYIFGIYP